MRVNPPDPVLGPVPWNWLRDSLVYTETRYCEVEQDWFSAENDARRCVIRFSEYVKDLEAVMQVIYRDCFNGEDLPPHIPREHSPRERKNYRVNRGLSELGVNEDQIRERLREYTVWCRIDENYQQKG
jgi:hypothetical protein